MTFDLTAADLFARPASKSAKECVAMLETAPQNAPALPVSLLTLMDAVVAALDTLEAREQREERGFAARQRAVQRHALGRLRAELGSAYA